MNTQTIREGATKMNFCKVLSQQNDEMMTMQKIKESCHVLD